MNPSEKNWAGNWKYQASEAFRPTSASEVQEIVRRETNVKAIGTRHSFNGAADTVGVQVSMHRLNRVLTHDAERRTVTVEAGITCGDLACYLKQHGLALRNMASLPHISVGGACATSTHGSGDRNGSLSTMVAELEMVDGLGDLISFRRGDPDFDGVAVHLGALGVVTSLTLDVVPHFDVAQHVYTGLPFEALEDYFDDIFGAAYSVSLFTDWRQPRFNQVWLKRTSEQDLPPSEFFGAVAADRQLHPLEGMPSENCTVQLGAMGSWDERLPHFQLEFTPSAGEELQSEYIVPRGRAYEALCAVRELRQEIAPLLYISEIRSIAADDLWMSMYYKRESVGIHFTWKQHTAEVASLLPKIEEALTPFAARPHWGKLFARRSFSDLYHRLPDFRDLVNRHDPSGKFRNDYVEALLQA
ncbi:MAG TPA: FAD-binding protein [Fimbriimonas sp.]|nr:FAD-binding protein [Fimbriimonas sp.]